MTFAEIVSNKRAKAKEVFGEDIDLSEPNILNLLINLSSWGEDNIWQLAENVYHSMSPAYATGEALTDLATTIGIVRRTATRSTGTVTFTGVDGTKIISGLRLSTTNGKVFTTTESGEIKDGTAKIKVESLEFGADTNVLENSITEFMMPVSGLNSVNNIDPTSGGQDVETDAELYNRYMVSITKGGGSTAAAIKAALLATEGVLDAEVKENVSDIEVNGLPPHSIAPVIHGGEDDTVARTILEHKAGGIRSYGTTLITISDDDYGTEQKIGFTRVQTVPVYVKVKTSEDVNEDIITRAILNYIGGTDKDGITYSGLGLGEDVSITGVTGSIWCIGALRDFDVSLSTDSVEWSKENIHIDDGDVAVCKGVILDE